MSQNPKSVNCEECSQSVARPVYHAGYTICGITIVFVPEAWRRSLKRNVD